jgi:Met-zincin
MLSVESDHRWAVAANIDYRYTASSFQQAADEWNALSFGIAISATTDQAKANFLVKYYKPTPPERWLAKAFFPNEVKDVLVYDRTLVEPDWRKVLKNTFLHEIGHIIGLRHEFANDPNPKDNNKPFESPAQRFGSVNPHSVMSYDDVNYINDMDKKDVKDFYKLGNRSLINGVPITDYAPKPLQQK